MAYIQARYKEFELKHELLYFKEKLVNKKNFPKGAGSGVKSYIDYIIEYACHLEARDVTPLGRLPQDSDIIPAYTELMEIIKQKKEYNSLWNKAKALKVDMLTAKLSMLHNKPGGFTKHELQSIELQIKTTRDESEMYVDMPYYSLLIPGVNWLFGDQSRLKLSSHEDYRKTEEYAKRKAAIEANPNSGSVIIKEPEMGYKTTVLDPHIRHPDERSQKKYKDDMLRDSPINMMQLPNPSKGIKLKEGFKDKIIDAGNAGEALGAVSVKREVVDTKKQQKISEAVFDTEFEKAKKEVKKRKKPPPVKKEQGTRLVLPKVEMTEVTMDSILDGIEDDSRTK